MELIEKAAYLQGLMEGLGLDESTREGKVLHAMSSLLAEMAASIKAMEQDITQAESQLDGLREDVEELQADFYEDEDDAEAPCYEVDCPSCGETVYVTEEDLDAGEAFCTNCGCTFEVALDDSEEGAGEEAAGDDEQDASYEVTCPSCGAVTVLDEETLLSGKARCAGCGKPLEIDLPDET